MDEKEKIAKAKENYNDFLSRLSEKTVTQEKKMVAVYVYRQNGEAVQDFYWSDNDLTPTALWRWIKNYNKKTVKRDLWINEVRLPPSLYDELLPMYYSDEETETSNLSVEGVRIVKG